MFPTVFLLLGLAAGPTKASVPTPPSFTEALYERPMAPAKLESWFTLLGEWDASGSPKVLDLSFTIKENNSILGFSKPIRFYVTLEDGMVKDWGGYLTQASHASTQQWELHGYLTFDGRSLRSIRMKAPGRPEATIPLEWDAPGNPHLRIWERDGKLRWEIREGWQIKVDSTVTDGEFWKPLGEGPSGAADLKEDLPHRPVLRVIAFRGLRCHAETFVPGKGFLKEARPYMQPSFMVATERMQGHMVGWPRFWFAPSIDPPIGYLGKAKIHLDWARLPFDPEKLFPNGFVQKVFQAEWQGIPVGREANFGIQQSMLRDPERYRNLKLYRLLPEPGGAWRKDFIMTCHPPNTGFYPGRPMFSGSTKYGPARTTELEASFKYYFVLVDEADGAGKSDSRRQ